MLFPKERMGHTSTYQGNKSEEGWLILSIGNMELEGVNKVFIDLRDVEEVKERAAKESEALGKAKRLLGGE
ncbi:MAG TPA: hypothetical protein VMX94_00745 [Armatimonadota bacterium]|nr:hypothetical protein [Armatimonadota bacterium]